MKKTIILSLIAIFAAGAANAGYYRTKNTITGTYQSTGRINNMGMKRAPAGHHTNSWGQVQRNNLF
jgi:hypothetical protein